LNLSNPLVASLLGWLHDCLREVGRELEEQEKERRTSEEAKQLAKQARDLERLLNDDFRSLQMQLDRIRRVAHTRQQELTNDVLPGTGTQQTEYQMGGPEHGEGSRGDLAGGGEQERPGASLLTGEELGSAGRVSEQRQKQSTFHVEYRHEERQSPRSHYESDSRTIVINLDHPQVARAAQASGGIDGKQFQEMTHEIAFVEYAIALGHEKLNRDEFYSGSDALFDMRDTINRVSRVALIT